MIKDEDFARQFERDYVYVKYFFFELKIDNIITQEFKRASSACPVSVTHLKKISTSSLTTIPLVSQTHFIFRAIISGTPENNPHICSSHIKDYANNLFTTHLHFPLGSSFTSLFGSRDSLMQPPKWEYLTPLTVNPGYHYAATVYENNVYISGGELTPTTVWKFDSTFR